MPVWIVNWQFQECLRDVKSATGYYIFFHLKSNGHSKRYYILLYCKRLQKYRSSNFEVHKTTCLYRKWKHSNLINMQLWKIEIPKSNLPKLKFSYLLWNIAWGDRGRFGSFARTLQVGNILMRLKIKIALFFLLGHAWTKEWKS